MSAKNSLSSAVAFVSASLALAPVSAEAKIDHHKNFSAFAAMSVTPPTQVIRRKASDRTASLLKPGMILHLPNDQGRLHFPGFVANQGCFAQLFTPSKTPGQTGESQTSGIIPFNEAVKVLDSVQGTSFLIMECRPEHLSVLPMVEPDTGSTSE